MAFIPKSLRPYIDTAFPDHVCLVGTVQPDGYAQISPRGSTQVYDDEHISTWERGRGATAAVFADGVKATVFFWNFDLKANGLLPLGGIARFYGVVSVHKSGPVYDRVWDRLIEPERKGDPDKKGFAVLIKVERAEDLFGQPLKLD